MQWHPIFAHLLRPLVESHYEVRTDQAVGDLPRTSDIVLLRKTTQSPAPFKGLWRRLTTWNVLEYKGPTVSPRFDELHDLLELGLGIHRRLNEVEAKEQRPEVDYPEVSFWYLVNHLGRRFLADLPAHLPGVAQVAEGIWQAQVYRHPVLLISVQELTVERDSLVLHILAGVPDQARGTVTEALKAEPALWKNYGGWLATYQPAIWQEIYRMATEQEQKVALDFGPLVAYLKEANELKRFMEAVGIKEAIAVVGADQTVEAMPAEQIWAAASPEKREELLRIGQRNKPAPGSDPT
jgi:hypothetical protein